MPLYTVDNPSKDFGKATDAAKALLGDNLVKVEAINMAMPSRVSVETKSAIDSSELAITLAKLVPKAAVTPDSKGTEPAPVVTPPVVEAPPVVAPEPVVATEPAPLEATPEPAPAAPPVKIVP